jgi:hypothetical protein
MGIASFSRSVLLSALRSPLQALATLWEPSHPRAKPAAGQALAGFRGQAANDAFAPETIAGKAHPSRAANPKQAQMQTPANMPRRLKVVREFEAGISPTCAGRMVISGRMADVCAELDRMVQGEAALARAA